MTHEPTPLFVTLASRADRVLDFGHAHDLSAAQAWCEKALQVFEGSIDQVAIVRLHEVRAIRGGNATTMAAVHGWTWDGSVWRDLPPDQVHLEFDEIGPGPTSLQDLTDSRSVGYERMLPRAEECSRSVEDLLSLVPPGLWQVAAAARQQVLQRRRVLVVDDDTLSRSALRLALADRHDVTEADGFAAALVELAVRRFDAVVTDHEMGQVGTGTDLLAEVRGRWPHALRVLCTGAASEGERALGAGIAQHYLRKPVERDELLALLQLS